MAAVFFPSIYFIISSFSFSSFPFFFVSIFVLIVLPYKSGTDMGALEAAAAERDRDQGLARSPDPGRELSLWFTYKRIISL